jgi:ribosomal protein S25
MTITDKDQRVLLNLLKQKEKIEDAEILDQEALDKINAEIAMIDPSYLEA